MAETEIEYADRYSGGKSPHPLTVCGGHCEGTGEYPVRVPRAWAHTADFNDDYTSHELREILRIQQTEGVPADHWYFIPCDACDGTGRCPEIVTLLRLPGWLWKGLRFLWDSRFKRRGRMA